MVTLLVYALVAIVAVGALYGIALLFLGQEHISPAVADRAPWAISDDELRPQDVVDVRLPVALRGYRFAETDQLLDRLTEELRRRDEEISQLRAATITAPAVSSDPAVGSNPSFAEPDPPASRGW